MISSCIKWLLSGLFLLPILLSAQEQASNIVFATGGAFNTAGNRVELFTMHPDSSTPQLRLAEFGDFSNAVVADHRFAYMHVGRSFGHPSGQDVVIRYDLVKGEAVDSFRAAGVQRMVVSDQYLIVTRGFGADSNFVLIFDKNDLAKGPVYRDKAVNYQTLAVATSKDRAYVSYDEDGRGAIAAFSLDKTGVQFLQSYTLDSSAAGISSLCFYGNGLVGQAEVTSFPPPTFMEVVESKAVFRFDTANGSFLTDNSVTRSNSAVGLVGDFLYGNYGGGIQGYDLSTVTPTYTDTVFKDGITAGVFNRVDSVFAFQETDYFSFGRVALVPYADPSMSSNFSTPISGSAIDIGYNQAPKASIAYFLDKASDTLDISPFYTDPDKDDVRITWVETPPSGTPVTILSKGRIVTSLFRPAVLKYAVKDDFGATDTSLIELDFSVGIAHGLPNFRLYPNPASDKVCIEFDKQYPQLVLEILNLQGQQVYEVRYAQSDRVVIPVDRLSNGMYMVRVRSGKGVMVRRFVKR